MTSALVRFVTRPGVVRSCQVATGIVMLAAGIVKIGDLNAFSSSVHNFRIAPIWSENLVAMTLPWVEVVAGLALVGKWRVRAAASVALGLMVVFTVAVAAAWARGLDFECGCFGKATAGAIGGKKLLENLGLTALALVASARAPSADLRVPASFPVAGQGSELPRRSPSAY